MKLSEECQRLENVCQKPSVSFGQLVAEISPKTHALVCLIFAFPFLLPLPLPGLSIPFGVLIALAGLRMLQGRGPWVPKRFRDKPLPAAVFAKALGVMQKVLSYIEPWIKPRWAWICTEVFHQITVVIITFCGVLLALPLPPGTNAPPAFLVALLAVGILEEDGVLIALGFCLFGALTIALVMLGVYGVNALEHHFW